MVQKNKLLIFFILVFDIVAFSQTDEEKILNSYESYTNAHREVVYVHLNKSVYVEGEMLGFKAYAFDKFTKEPSQLTSNLYCIITDGEGNLIKEKLVHVKNGVAHNVFNIDSTFTKPNYTFKAYTNYMLNFKEQNHFEQDFSVIYADDEAEIKTLQIGPDIDIQVLPEGGLLLNNTINTIGIIAKNSSGLGVGNLTGKIIDNEKTVVTEFKLNEFGIGKTVLTPESNSSYILEITTATTTIKIPINDIKQQGIAMTVSEFSNKVAVQLKTNQESIKALQSKALSMAIHNGNEMRLFPVRFKNDLETKLIVEDSILFTGINIITLFDDKNNPLLERLYFNYKGVQTNTLSNFNTQKIKDSLSVKFKIDNFDREKFSSLSVSVLPSDTKSYGHHHNIQSFIYLQPYINSFIENASYYFTNVSNKTKYDLDLLLITQGWSSYDWKSIFNPNMLLSHPFERGINVQATVNDNDKGGTYIVYPLKNNTTAIFDLKAKETQFSQENLLPIEEESYKIGLVKSNDKFKKPGVYLRFNPSDIPNLPLQYNFSSPTEKIILSNYQNGMMTESWENYEVLDEILIESKGNNTKAEKLKSKSTRFQYDILDDGIRLTGMRLSVYLDRIGWRTREFQGEFIITNPRVHWGPRTPLIYLDGALLNGTSGLVGLNLEVIDYIESDFYGFTGGVNGSAGTLRIYTDPSILLRLYPGRSNVAEFKIPLTFAVDKKFYTPTYQFYSSRFFKEYGVINWFGNVVPDENGFIDLTFFDTQTESIHLYIEGITNTKELVSEIKTLKF